MMREPADLDEMPAADRWMVSWADFTTLLFALFVVLYASSTVNHDKTQQVSHSLGQAFGAAQPAAREMPQPAAQTLTLNKDQQQAQNQAQKMTVIANDIRQALGTLIESGQVSVTQNTRGIGIDINASLLFAAGDAQLSAASVQVTSTVAGVLARYPYAIQIEGHTDSVPIHNAQFASNWELSSVRASSVVRRLVEAGIAEQRLAVIGHGANVPLDGNDTAAGRARNRRVHVLILVETG